MSPPAGSFFIRRCGLYLAGETAAAAAARQRARVRHLLLVAGGRPLDGETAAWY